MFAGLNHEGPKSTKGTEFHFSVPFCCTLPSIGTAGKVVRYETGSQTVLSDLTDFTDSPQTIDPRLKIDPTPGSALRY